MKRHWTHPPKMKFVAAVAVICCVFLVHAVSSEKYLREHRVKSRLIRIRPIRKTTAAPDTTPLPTTTDVPVETETTETTGLTYGTRIQDVSGLEAVESFSTTPTVPNIIVTTPPPGKNDDEDDGKSLAMEVAAKDGKYGLIDQLLPSGPKKAPGVISYATNELFRNDIESKVPSDDIWLAEGHLLVLRGGSYPPSHRQRPVPWPAIDDYNAPPRPVKVPEKPHIPPPFPIRFENNGRPVFLGQSTVQPPFFPYPPYPFHPPQNGTHPPFPFPPPPPDGTLPPLPPPDIELPPSKDNLTDDPSIFYPPPYDFVYEPLVPGKSNTTHDVNPGPFAPGLILPPPPELFQVVNNTAFGSYFESNEYYDGSNESGDDDSNESGAYEQDDDEGSINTLDQLGPTTTALPPTRPYVDVTVPPVNRDPLLLLRRPTPTPTASPFVTNRVISASVPASSQDPNSIEYYISSVPQTSTPPTIVPGYHRRPRPFSTATRRPSTPSRVRFPDEDFDLPPTYYYNRRLPPSHHPLDTDTLVNQRPPLPPIEPDSESLPPPPPSGNVYYTATTPAPVPRSQYPTPYAVFVPNGDGTYSLVAPKGYKPAKVYVVSNGAPTIAAEAGHQQYQQQRPRFRSRVRLPETPQRNYYVQPPLPSPAPIETSTPLPYYYTASASSRVETASAAETVVSAAPRAGPAPAGYGNVDGGHVSFYSKGPGGYAYRIPLKK